MDSTMWEFGNLVCSAPTDNRKLFFEYPDTLAANVIITNSTPPIDVVANASGNIELLNVKNKDNVRKGQVLAVVHSTSNYKDVMFLKKICSNG